ncbi:MAG: putative LuxR-family regulator [Mycobacterium sp.]|nr:putative LuxR-family regulator [Mycobacterium sp.]
MILDAYLELADITASTGPMDELGRALLDWLRRDVTWSECLIPAGYHEALAAARFGDGGRHIGFLALLSGSRQPPPTTVRRRLQKVIPVVARAVDPLRSLATAARVVHCAFAGTVLCTNGGTRPLPGLDGDALLDEESPVVVLARARLKAGQVYTSFLWPRGDGNTPSEHVRVTVLAGTDDAPACFLGTLILSPATDLRGLTPRELDVLGLLVDGHSNQQIGRKLFVTPRTVAAHLEHILVKLGAPTRTLAAVRAEREGLYVPPLPTPGQSPVSS